MRTSVLCCGMGAGWIGGSLVLVGGSGVVIITDGHNSVYEF